MPCMKKVYSVKQNLGPLVSSRERRVAVVPLIPGHALHEKGLQGQKGVGPLVSSQAGRAAVVPRINRG